jgi:hypothetical protein
MEESGLEEILMVVMVTNESEISGESDSENSESSNASGGGDILQCALVKWLGRTGEEDWIMCASIVQCN